MNTTVGKVKNDGEEATANNIDTEHHMDQDDSDEESVPPLITRSVAVASSSDEEDASSSEGEDTGDDDEDSEDDDALTIEDTSKAPFPYHFRYLDEAQAKDSNETACVRFRDRSLGTSRTIEFKNLCQYAAYRDESNEIRRNFVAINEYIDSSGCVLAKAKKKTRQSLCGCNAYRRKWGDNMVFEDIRISWRSFAAKARQFHADLPPFGSTDALVGTEVGLRELSADYGIEQDVGPKHYHVMPAFY